MGRIKKSNILLTCGLAFFGAAFALGAVVTVNSVNNQTYEEVYADTAVSYISRSWNSSDKVVVDQELSCSTYTTLTSSHDELFSGWYVLKNNVLRSYIEVKGDTKLILCDGCTLSVDYIKVGNSSGVALTIYSQTEGTGRLVANRDGYAIGGYPNGPITIHGGVVSATSTGYNAAAIGSGDGIGAAITIYGGTITAQGGENGAGIGGGGSGGTVNIYGGTVTATGGQNGAGIGGGSGSGGTVNIYGGTVTATGGKYAAGIGGTANYGGGTTTISGGTVIAQGGEQGAGIGGGGSGSGGTVAISGNAVVTATGGEAAAGIGGGSNGGAGNITFSDNVVVTTHGGDGSYFAPGFGHGYNSSDNGTLTIGEDLSVYDGSSTGPALVIDNPLETPAKHMIVKETIPLDPVSYVYRSWDNTHKVVLEEDRNVTNYKFISSYAGNNVSLRTGWYVLNEDYSGITDCIEITDGRVVNIILCDGYTFSLKRVYINNGTLNIFGQSGGTGALSAIMTVDDNKLDTSAIEIKSGSALNVYGGKVTASTGFAGPGISAVGGLNVYGGEVTATGSHYMYGAAGIGGTTNGAGGSVNVYGGKVTANGGESGTNGIGAGSASSDQGTLNIANNNLRVYGNNSNAVLTAADMKTDYDTNRWLHMAVVAAPEYTVPTGLEVEYGKTLADITLPSGWSWVDSTTSVGEIGVNNFNATYVPDNPYYLGVLEQVSITVTKVTPTDYTVPTGLTAIAEDNLSDIALPAHWTWKEPNTDVGVAGEHQFTAIYTPEDTEHYNTVEESITVTVQPAPAVSYISRSWNEGSKTVDNTEKSCNEYHKIKSNTTELTTGWYVLRSDVVVNNRMSINGLVNIILEDGCTLTPIKGITLEGDNVLNLYGQNAGTGKIALQYDSYYDSPLGSLKDSNRSGGTFNMYGGTITYNNTSDYMYASVIGGGFTEAGCEFTMYGGTIDINSNSASGIGGGYKGDNRSFVMYGGSITIVNGGGYATCIGSGKEGTCNSIIINGGSVDTTMTDAYGTAIGCGGDGISGNITFNGGTVMARSTSSYSGAIGTGNEGTGGIITINGGTVTAIGGRNAAAIGGNYKGTFEEVIINGGTVTAQGGENGAGIGGGSESNAGKITINGGTVIATGGDNAAGIGGGRFSDGGAVTINGGTVTATGGEDSFGIGAGYHYNAVSQGSLTINDDYQILGGTSENPTEVINKENNDYARYRYMIVNEAHHYSNDIDSDEFFKCTDDGCGFVNQGRKDTQDTYKSIKHIADETKPSEDWIDAIQSAREKYDDLETKFKDMVPNYQTLLDAETELAKYLNDKQHAEEVEEKIWNIAPVQYTETCKTKIDIAREAYDALTADQKLLVNNYNDLLHAEEVYGHIKNVDEKIDDIGEVQYTEACKTKIDSAREAYDALTNEEKNLFPQDKLNALLAAEAAYKALDDQAKADNVKTLINDIGTVEYTKTCKDKIDNARKAYDILTPDQKTLVTNYEVLLAAEANYKKLDDKAKSKNTEALINNIGDVELTDTCKEKIDAARESYDALSPEAKDLVTNYDVLTQDEKTYKHVKTVADKIDAIGEVINGGEKDSKEAIENAIIAYYSLTEEERSILPNTKLEILIAAEETYEQLGHKVNAFCIVLMVLDLLFALAAAAYVLLRIKPFKIPEKIENIGDKVIEKEVLLTFILAITLLVNFILDLVMICVHPCGFSIAAFVIGFLLFGGIMFWYVVTRRKGVMTPAEQTALTKTKELTQKVFKKKNNNPEQ